MFLYNCDDTEYDWRICMQKLAVCATAEFFFGLRDQFETWLQKGGSVDNVSLFYHLRLRYQYKKYSSLHKISFEKLRPKLP
jgi:hypothetical protein